MTPQTTFKIYPNISDDKYFSLLLFSQAKPGFSSERCSPSCMKKSRPVKWQETLEKIYIPPEFFEEVADENRLSAFREMALNHGFYGPEEA